MLVYQRVNHIKIYKRSYKIIKALTTDGFPLHKWSFFATQVAPRTSVSRDSEVGPLGAGARN